ncbi:MAG: hypothetical protein R2787_08645 [Saprospiraceae bacterium]
MYILIILLTGCAHLWGLLEGESSYAYLYGAKPYYAQAVILFAAGSLMTCLGLWIGEGRLPEWPRASLHHPVSGKVVLPAFLISLLPYFFPVWVPTSFGVIKSLLTAVLPLGLLFILARESARDQHGRRAWIAVVAVLAMAIHKVLFAYLRIEMILPVVIYGLGIWTAENRSFRTWINTRTLLLAGYTVVFVLAFPWIHSHRGVYGTGQDRLTYIQEAGMPAVFSGQYHGENVLTRMGQLNQLSHVVRIAGEDGFYLGKTLSYLPMVWIPRVFWPDKPRIAMGQWFNNRRKDQVDPEVINYQQTSSSSMNMTIPGELYLNFGWPGALLGSLLTGLLLAMFWKQCRLYREDRLVNIPGQLMAAYLLVEAMGQFGADLQSLVTTTGVYVTLLGLSYAWKGVEAGMGQRFFLSLNETKR